MSDPRSELAILGKELGAFRWAQGPGGNVSIKSGDELWVKASGKRLSDVALDSGHARATLDMVRRALGGDKEADLALFARTPRPSLETYFHALGPTVVAHTHALGALLLACTRSPLERLPGVVKEVPYVRPGPHLAKAVANALDTEAREQLVLLRSHGLIAYAETAARASAITRELDEAVRARFSGLASAEELLAKNLEHAVFPIEGGVARRLPPRKRTTAVPRYLFPDAAVCASALLVDELRDEVKDASRALAEVGRSAYLIDESGRRVAFAKSATQLEQSVEVLTAHDWITDALAGREAVYLPDDEPAALLNLPSEQYRIRLSC